MSSQNEPSFTPSNQPLPGNGTGQPQKNNSNRNLIIGIVIAALLLCCICGTTAGLGAAAFFYLHRTTAGQTTIDSTPEFIEPTIAEEISATPENIISPSETPVPEATSTNVQGLGVTRDAMLQFFNSGDAFNFGKPTEIQGVEVVQGEHKSLCIQTNCAAVTLLGPADDLLSVSVVVPTDPQNVSQTTVAMTLLLDAADQFTGNNSNVPMQIMSDLIQAQSAGNNFEKTFQESGYSFTENYFAQTHNAGIVITRPK